MRARHQDKRWLGRLLGIMAATVGLGVVMALVACAKCGGSADPEEMERLATVMLRAAKSAQGMLLTREADPTRPDELPGRVLESDGNIRSMLECYLLRASVLRDANGKPRAVMLLCTKDGSQALIERMDCLNSARKGQHWQAVPTLPCEATFRDPAVACADN